MNMTRSAFFLSVKKPSVNFMVTLLLLAVASHEAFPIRPKTSFHVLPKTSTTTQTTSMTTTQLGSLMGFLNDGKKALVKTLAGDYDSVAIQERIQGVIKTNPVIMLSFTTCPYCLKAKSILDGMGAKYSVIELDVDPDGKAIRAELSDLVGRTSVPAIWINQEFIGGCNDGGPNGGGIVQLEQSGTLRSMLQQVGAL